MQVTPDNQRRILFIRVVTSVVVFTVFAITAVAWVMTQDPTLKWALFVPLVASVLVLPRDVVLPDADEETVVRTKLYLSYLRLTYFLVALVVMLGLPEILF